MAPASATPRPWAALATLMLPVLLVSVDNTVLNFALPLISLDFSASSTVLLWIVDAYPLVLAGLLVTMGSLGDRIGRRLILLIGSTGFAVVSVMASMAPSGEALIAARAFLGFFGAMLMPATLSLIRNIFTHQDQRRTAIAIWAACFAAGSALGPLVAGVLLEYFGWGSVFLIAVPVLIPTLIFTPIFVPESKDPSPGPLPVVDAILSIITLAPAVYAIKTIAHDGFSVVAVLSMALSVVAGVWFARRQLTRPEPMLDLRLFALPKFTGSVLSNLLAVFSLIGFLFFASQHLQLVIGLSPLAAGLTLLPGAIATVIAGLAVVPLARRVPVHVIVAGALLLNVAGYLVVMMLGNGAGSGIIAVAFIILSVGMGGAETLTNDNIVAAVPPNKAGAASAISETAYEVGNVLGTAILGTILTSAYTNNVRLPDGLTPPQQQAAGETLGGAVSTASELAPDIAKSLLESAHHAFDSGAATTSVLAAVVMTVASVVAFFTLRNDSRRSPAAPSEGDALRDHVAVAASVSEEPGVR